MQASHPTATYFTNQELTNELLELRVFARAALKEQAPQMYNASIVVHEIDRLLGKLLATSEYERLDEPTNLSMREGL